MVTKQDMGDCEVHLFSTPFWLLGSISKFFRKPRSKAKQNRMAYQGESHKRKGEKSRRRWQKDIHSGLIDEWEDVSERTGSGLAGCRHRKKVQTTPRLIDWVPIWGPWMQGFEAQPSLVGRGDPLKTHEHWGHCRMEARKKLSVLR
jgi:hypothetical protein